MGRTRLAKQELYHLYERLSHSEKRKKELLNYLENLKKLYKLDKISYQRYVEIIHQKRNGRTIEEWIHFYHHEALECHRQISAYKKHSSKRRLLTFFSFSILTILLIYFFGFAQVGFVTYDQNVSQLILKDYSQDIDLRFKESGTYILEIENPGQLDSLQLEGFVQGEGLAKVYFETPVTEDKLLIFDSSQIKETKSKTITALAISEEQEEGESEPEPEAEEEEEPEAEEEEPEAEEETKEEESSEQEDSSPSQDPELGSGDSQEDSPSSDETEATEEETTEEETTSETEETVEEETTSEEIEDSEIIEDSNETTTNQTLEEINQTEIEDSQTEDSSPSQEDSQSQLEKKRFSDFCIETCDLEHLELNETSYKLIIEISDKAILTLKKADYRILKVVPKNQSENLEPQITEIAEGANATISTKQFQAVIGRPVKWKKTIELDKPSAVKVIIPKEAENITAKKYLEDESLEEIDDVKKEITKQETAKIQVTGLVVAPRTNNKPKITLFFKKIFSTITGRAITEEKLEVEIEDNATKYEIEYFTEPPQAFEEPLSKGKKIIITGPDEVHYENILAFTELEREATPDQIKLYHLDNNSEIETEITTYDLNENGLIDYIEWTVPHLSEQQYILIIEIKGAEHLDENREFISDIYNETFQLDGIWSSPINNNEYVRVIFEENLTSDKDITLYARGNKNNIQVEVYEYNSSNLIATFPEILNEGYYKIYLTNLTSSSQDTFDLKVIGSGNSYIELDYIVDPVSAYDFTAGTSTGYTNPANAWDSTDDTYATRNIPKKTDPDTGNYITFTSNNIPILTDTINTVEIGIEGYGESGGANAYLIPIFGGTTNGNTYSIPAATFGSSDDDLTDYVDITSDPNAPGTWTWNDLVNLDVRAYGGCTSNGQSRMMYIDQVRIRVDYTDATPPASVTNLNSPSQGSSWIYWTWTNPLDSDFNQAIIYIDDINVANTSNNYYNATGFSPGTSHTIKIHTKDTTGNVNNTDVTDTRSTIGADAIAPNIFQIFPSNNAVNVNGNATFNCSATDNQNLANISLYFQGSLNQTNSVSGLSASTIFYINNLANGDYTWYCEAKDFNSNTNQTSPYSLKINTTAAPTYNPTAFDGNTTDFLSVPDITNVCNAILDNSSTSEIQWENCINAENADFDTNILLQYNNITLISENLDSSFNSSAIITFRNLPWDAQPLIYREGIICEAPDCINLSYNPSTGIAVFNVSHFTSYATQGNSRLEIWDETDTGMPYADQIKYPNEQIKFFSNYTTKNNGNPITGATCYINFSDASGTMNYNATSLLYEYLRSFSSSGTFDWNSTCSASGAQTIALTDNVTVSSGENPNVTIASPNQGDIYQTNTSIILETNLESNDGIQDVIFMIDFPNGSSANYTPEHPDTRIIDGVMTDWSSLDSVGTDADDSSPILDDFDLKEAFVSHNDTDIMFRMNVYGSAPNGVDFGTYFYDIFVDADMDSSTGYNQSFIGGGFDYLIENGNLYNYSGTGGAWGWTFSEAIPYAISADESDLELSVTKSKIQSTNSGEIKFFYSLSDGANSDYFPNSNAYVYNYYRYLSLFNTTNNIGSHNFTVYGNTLAGGVNNTEQVSFDIVNLNTTIHSPINTTYASATVLVNLSGNGESIFYDWEGTNVTYTSPVNVTFATGSNTLYAYTNDSSGNINYTSVTFEVTAANPPEVTEIYPQNGTNYSLNSEIILQADVYSANPLDTVYGEITFPNQSKINLTFQKASTKTIDGTMTDWLSTEVVGNDQNETLISDDHDIQRAFISNNGSDIFFREDLYGLINFTLPAYYEVLIDSDLNESTGWSKDGVWDYGYEYLVENGNLYSYNQGLGGWNWNFVAALDYGISGDGKSIEWRVPRSLIGNTNIANIAFTAGVGNITTNDFLRNDPDINTILHRYYNSNTHKYFFNSTFTSGIYNISIYANNTLGLVNNTEQDWFYITDDTTPPGVTLIEPYDNQTVNQRNVSFSCDVTDNIQLQNVTLYTTINGSWQPVTPTRDVSGTENSTSWNITNIPTGMYEWNCLAYDTNHNRKYYETNWTFNVSVPPQITYVSPIPNINPIELSASPVTFSATVYDPDGTSNINTSSVYANFSRAGETTRENLSCSYVGDIDAYNANFSCTIDMWYFDSPGDWNVSVYAQDLDNDYSTNSSTFFQYNQLQALTISTSNIDFTVSSGATNQLASNDPMVLNNTGNANLTSKIAINAINLLGETNPSFSINAENFSANIADNCAGPRLQNATDINITGSVLESGNLSLGGGTAQEDLYYCLNEVGLVQSQAYSTSQGGAWYIKIVLSLAIVTTSSVSRKTKKKKKSKRKVLVENLSIPITIFTNKLGGLEGISKYLKENLGLTYHEIAELLNRNDRTIWSIYNKAIKKQPTKLTVKKTLVYVPTSIFQNRKYTILEAIVVYLKDKGMKYVEIAELLNRDQRNIWTIYNRSMKK